MYIYHWTYGAVECYKRNLVCGPDCSNYYTCLKFMKKDGKPPMKDAVISLIRKRVPLRENIYEDNYKAD